MALNFLGHLSGVATATGTLVETRGGGDVARAGVGHLVKIEVEIDRLDQLDEALAEKADAVLLDPQRTGARHRPRLVACFGRRRKVSRLKAPISSAKGDPP